MPVSKPEKPVQSRPQNADTAVRTSRSAPVPGSKLQSSRLKPSVKQSRGRSPSPASRKKDTSTEKKDSELTHSSAKGNSVNREGQKKDDKVVDSSYKSRVPHHRTHDKHTDDDLSKSHEASKPHSSNKHTKHHASGDKLKPSKVEHSSSARSKSPSRNRPHEHVEKSKTIHEDSGEELDEQANASGDDNPVDEDVESSKVVERIKYSKKEIMALKDCELAKQKPAELTDEIMSLLNSDPNRPKYPATLSLRKEGNESRSFPEVTLSPQRGSFSSGCKYKSTKDPANKDTSSDVPSTPLSARTTDDTSKFTFRDDDTSMHKEFSQYRTPHGPHSGSHYSWQRSTSHSNSYRDYNGSAAQDDKTHSKPSYSRYSHHESSGSFRGSISSQSYYQADSYSEPEPEWMQFGPSSRTDFMELGGEDEIEKLREEFKARQRKVDQAFNKTSSKQDSAETPSDSSDKDQETFGDTTVKDQQVDNDELDRDNDVFNNEGQGTEQAQRDNHAMMEADSLLAGNAGDEFAVDLNRILNICDDMEDDGVLPGYGGGSQLSKLFASHNHSMPPPPSSSGDPSNLLMQVLGVNQDNQLSRAGPHHKSMVVGNKIPANALTLDEVLAKENINVTDAATGDEGDQSAFKKLLAIVQQQSPDGGMTSAINPVLENNRHLPPPDARGVMYSSQERGSPRNTLDQYALHDLLHSEEPLQPSLPIPIGYDRFSRQQDMGPLYMHEEEKITAAELANIEQQQQRMGPLQPPVQQHNMDQKRLLEHHVQQGVQEHVIKQVEQQQRQRAAAQFRQHQHQQMQQQQQQQQQQARMNHQQMMAMEQQKRMSGGMMYPSMQPQPKHPMVSQPLNFMPTSVMKRNFKQSRNMSEMNKPSTRLEQDLNQKAVSTHSSISGLLSLPDEDHQFMHDQRPTPFSYSSLPRMGIPPPVHGADHLPRYPMPPPPHHMMQGPPPPGYMMGPPHPRMPPYPAAAKHNSLPPGPYYNWN